MAISNSWYNKIMRTYELQQASNRVNLKKKLDALYEKEPRLQELNAGIGKRALERFRAFRAGEAEALSDLSVDIANIKKEKESLLLKHGFSLEYMEMDYACATCKDTGFVEGEKCHCFKKKIIELLYAQSNIEKIIERENFSTFSYAYYDGIEKIPEIGITNLDYMHVVTDICHAFVQNFHTTHENLLFMGHAGVGKTFLINCIAKELMDTYVSVVYLTANELVEVLGKVKLGREEEAKYTELVEYLPECDLLIIDDLGTELSNSFTSTEIFHIINQRLNLEKATIISTNLSMKALRDIYSERVTSRIAKSYTVIRLFGEDIRGMGSEA